jgi:UDP-N-acetylmuramoyl-tripeptide--D-alanyl-D-alanine ligase
VPVEAHLSGKHNVYNLLAALAVAAILGVPLAVAAAKLSILGPPPHRGERIRLRNEVQIIDETYNSNPTALASVLDSLHDEKAVRRIAVLGDMLELGERAEQLHLESGRKAAAAEVDLLIGVGPLSRHIIEGAREAGMPEEAMAAVQDAVEAGERVAARVEAGDLILFKASRGVGLDRAIDIVRERLGEESA